MALLRYANLGIHRPDILLSKAVSGLGDFYKYLDTTRKYLESTKAVKAIAWEKLDDAQSGVWIQLVEPADNCGDFEKNLKLFLDESTDTVYEASPARWKAVGSAARECPNCRSHGKPKMAYATEEHADEIASELGNGLSSYECPDGYGWHLTGKSQSNVGFNKSNAISVLDRNVENDSLLLDRLPDHDYLVIRPNTYQLKCQINALQSLQDTPSIHHLPLLRLFEGKDHAKWPNVPYDEHLFNDDYYVLTDGAREGTSQQREFVNIALNTPDFAFLEGPPGSGKTTAICELILQLIKRGKRILLCASTHVAVDNVLERMMSEENIYRDMVLPVRIGDKSSVSQKAKPWQLEEFVKTERTRLLKHLQQQPHISVSQKLLKSKVGEGKHIVERLVLEAANLVCGTTIGLLQHPDIKNKQSTSPIFDVMIIDEASKTTFQEFLVPAVLAKRWIMVGDPKQLSPYVDDEATEVNLQPCLQDSYQREACADIFSARQINIQKREVSLVCTDDEKTIEFYHQQAKSKNVLVASSKGPKTDLPYASVVLGSSAFIAQNANHLPLDLTTIRGLPALPEKLEMRLAAHSRLTRTKIKTESDSWESQLAWRLARMYEQRLNTESNGSSKTVNKLEEDIKALLPFYSEKDTFTAIDRVRRIALPSILESLQVGFERTEYQKQGTALSDGLPASVLEQRQIRLSYQHRMHPDIAEFSRVHIYHEKALQSPDGQAEKRDWGYRSGSHRCIWHDVKGRKGKEGEITAEVEEILKELSRFDSWAKSNPYVEKNQQKPWEVAVLAFYRAQERAIRRALRKWTGNHHGVRHFYRGEKSSPYIDIQICTVDRFQGHEADFVMLSFANNHPTSFLESPNRLNVAITRAKHQLIVYGNRPAMQKASGVLGTFASNSYWSTTIETESQEAL
ncbi:heavy metal resistance protein CzcA [Vibrio rotiferianus]|uniref:DEAD/DEAH box helicase family protein n=1 Tax=Vibrio rotiferianus TaxID=190895 RepID=UPI0011107291|nr:AAA domain-containing protein [Vibrio rotiferianus]TMX32988.1 heavy metal resistance protein CzcA [Vibrio rotiferianus]TMX44688.1 heavy metal resistance protein CzcA [Vibrio rotiferianus]